MRYLALDGTEESDEGLTHLAQLPNLQDLSLKELPLTDRGLLHVGRLTRLTYLEIDATRLTDAGLMHLASLNALERLQLSSKSTGITEAAPQKLADQIPGLCVTASPGLWEQTAESGAIPEDSADETQ